MRYLKGGLNDEYCFHGHLTCGCRIAPLNHEVFDDAVELGVIVISSSAQLCKILACFWCMIPVQFKRNGSHPEKTMWSVWVGGNMLLKFASNVRFTYELFFWTRSINWSTMDQHFIDSFWNKSLQFVHILQAKNKLLLWLNNSRCNFMVNCQFYHRAYKNGY